MELELNKTWGLISFWYNIVWGKTLLISGQSILVFNNFTESWIISQKKKKVEWKEIKKKVYFYKKLYSIPNIFQLSLQNITS